MSNSEQPTSPQAPAESPYDEGLHGFWRNNGQAIAIFCGILLLGYLGKLAWDYFSNQREEGLEQEYAAATTPEGWRAFVEAHGDHPLTGVMEVRLADAAYAAGRLDEAISNYGKAASTLPKDGPLTARARLGLGMAKVQAGQLTDGEGLLHELADDKNGFRAIRAEANYQLASLAASAGRYADVRKYAAEILQADPSSPWAQRAFSLPTAPPEATPTSSANPSPSSVSFKTAPAK